MHDDAKTAKGKASSFGAHYVAEVEYRRDEVCELTKRLRQRAPFALFGVYTWAWIHVLILLLKSWLI